MVGTILFDNFQLPVIAAGADDFGAMQFRDFDRRQPDPASGTVDQYPFTGLQTSTLKQTMVGGEISHTKSSSRDVIKWLGRILDSGRIHNGLFSKASGPDTGYHPIADLKIFDIIGHF